MAMTQQKTFKIGEIAKLFHVGVDSVRYYEKVGLLHPIRDKENNYRLYTIDDVRIMNTIRELLDLGFSTEEILKFENNRNLDHVMAMLKKEEQVVADKIAALEKSRASIRGRLTALRENLARDCSGEVSMITLPERQCLMITESDMPDNMITYELAIATKNSDEKVSTIGCCDCYTLDINSFNDEGDDYRTKNVFLYSPYLDLPCNHTLPAGDYLSVCYRGAFEQTKKLVPKMLRYARRHHLTVMGDPMEFCHIDRFETADSDEYLTEIQMPVSAETKLF